MKELVIQPAKEGKGRSFRATLLSYVTADALWSGGATSTDSTRPVWMMLGGSENELRPFVANLRCGRKAELLRSSYRKSSDRFEVLKSAGFQVAWQRRPAGSVVTIFAPDLFGLDPGLVDPKGIEFCILPAQKWLAPLNLEARPHLEKLGLDIPEDCFEPILRTSALFIAYLDRRTRCPLIPDATFYAQVLAASLKRGFASWSTLDQYSYGRNPYGQHTWLGFSEYETEAVGLSKGLAFKASHEEFERFLAEQVRTYFERKSVV